MRKSYLDNNMNSSEIRGIGPVFGNFNSPGISAVSTNGTMETVNVSKVKEETNQGCFKISYRYIVTLFGFFMYFQLNYFRIGTSMSVVKMVNTTAVNIRRNFNNTIDSCPLNSSVTEEFPEPSAEGEFNWSSQMQSYILSAGFLGYVVSQIPGGMLSGAYGAKKMFFIGILISSLAHMLCPFAAWCNCYLMIVMQCFRGVGQGFMAPASSDIAAKWFPRPERGFLNSCIFQGYSVGSFTAYAISGVLCSSSLLGGWPLVYFVYGGFSLVFGLCVHLFLYESPKEHPNIGEAELTYILENQESDFSQKRPPTPWKKILTSVPVYTMVFANFADFWAMSQQLSEHPIFLANILHFPIQTNGVLNSIPFACEILVILIGSWFSKWLNTHGYVGVDKVRKGCTILYSLGYSLSLLGTYFAGCDRVWSNVFSIVGFSFSGFSVPGCVIVPADMSPTFAGSLFSFSNTVASSATFIFPLIVGAMIDVEDSLDQWRKIFLICIAVIMSSGILFCILGSAEVQPWNFPLEVDVETNRIENKNKKSTNKECTSSVETSTNL